MNVTFGNALAYARPTATFSSSNSDEDSKLFYSGNPIDSKKPQSERQPKSNSRSFWDRCVEGVKDHPIMSTGLFSSTTLLPIALTSVSAEAAVLIYAMTNALTCFADGFFGKEGIFGLRHKS